MTNLLSHLFLRLTGDISTHHEIERDSVSYRVIISTWVGLLIVDLTDFLSKLDGGGGVVREIDTGYGRKEQ